MCEMSPDIRSQPQARIAVLDFTTQTAVADGLVSSLIDSLQSELYFERFQPIYDPVGTADEAFKSMQVLEQFISGSSVLLCIVDVTVPINMHNLLNCLKIFERGRGYRPCESCVTFCVSVTDRTEYLSCRRLMDVISSIGFAHFHVHKLEHVDDLATSIRRAIGSQHKQDMFYKHQVSELFEVHPATGADSSVNPIRLLAEAPNDGTDIYQELLDSEIFYVRRIHYLLAVWLRPISRLAQLRPADFAQASHLVALLEPFQGILELHRGLLASAFNSLSSTIPLRLPPRVLASEISYVVTRACSNYTKVILLMEKASKQIESAQNVLQKPNQVGLAFRLCEMNVVPTPSPGEPASLMILPLARIPRYVLLLEELSARVPHHFAQDEETPLITEAAQVLRDLVAQINAARRSDQQLSDSTGRSSSGRGCCLS